MQTDKTRESLAEINKEFRELLKERPPTQEELRRVQDQMTLQLPGQRETINGLAGSIIEIIRYGLPEDYWDTYSAKVRALTVRDLAMAAERLVHPERLVWVIVGDRSKIEQGVRELNLGDLKVIDSDGNPAD